MTCGILRLMSTKHVPMLADGMTKSRESTEMVIYVYIEKDGTRSLGECKAASLKLIMEIPNFTMFQKATPAETLEYKLKQ